MPLTRGAMALMLAAESWQAKACAALLQAGANVDARDRDGKTALMQAAAGRVTAVCAALLEHGADTELRDSGGDSALITAARVDAAGVVSLLMEHGANTAARDRHGCTAAAAAAAHGAFHALRLLGESGGAGPGRVDLDHEVPPLMAALRGDEGCPVDLLNALGPRWTWRGWIWVRYSGRSPGGPKSSSLPGRTAATRSATGSPPPRPVTRAPRS